MFVFREKIVVDNEHFNKGFQKKQSILYTLADIILQYIHARL